MLNLIRSPTMQVDVLNASNEYESGASASPYGVGIGVAQIIQHIVCTNSLHRRRRRMAEPPTCIIAWAVNGYYNSHAAVGHMLAQLVMSNFHRHPIVGQLCWTSNWSNLRHRMTEDEWYGATRDEAFGSPFFRLQHFLPRPNVVRRLRL